MNKVAPRLVVASLTCLLGIAAVWYVTRPTPPRVMPAGRWESTAFIIINRHTAAANLADLRTVPLAGGDIEVRVWVGFGIFGEDCLILRRAAGQWSGFHLHGMAWQAPPVQSKSALAAPRSGWERAWERLEGAGILALPDAEAVQCNSGGLDGTHYIVEISANATYRTYKYSNPDSPKCREAGQMMEIGGVIAEEFNLPEFTASHTFEPTHPKGFDIAR